VRNRTVSAVAAGLFGFLLVAGLSGCCTHERSCREVPAKESEAAAVSTEQVPGALEYPRFYPVPTRPVFSPPGLELPSGELYPVPAESPTLTAVPSDGWRPVEK